MSQALITKDGVIQGWVSVAPVFVPERPEAPDGRKVASKEPPEQIRFDHEGKIYTATRNSKAQRLEYEIDRLTLATVNGWAYEATR